MNSLKMELVNDTHTINLAEVVKKIFIQEVESGTVIDNIFGNIR